MEKKKIYAALSTTALATLFTAALSSTAFAASTDILVQGKDGKNYQYNIDNLIDSFTVNKNLYNDFTSRGDTKAYYDAKTKEYVDVEKIVDAFVKAPKSFDLNTFTETAKASDVFTVSGTIQTIVVNDKGEVVPGPVITPVQTAKVDTVSAVDGTITVKLTQAPDATPVVADFAITSSIVVDKQSPAETAVTATKIEKDASDASGLTYKLTVPKVAPVDADQNVTYKVDYKSTGAKEATAFTVAKIPDLSIASVSASNKTTISVTLTDDNAKATDKASYAVKVGDETIDVTNVSYVKELKKASLTVNLDGKQGALTVNGVAAKTDVDYKAPTVASVTPLSQAEVYVQFSEKVDEATAEAASNYGIVQKGTAVVKPVGTAELLQDGKTVRVTLQKDKDGNQITFTEGTNYTVSVNAAKDLAGNAITTAINTDFVAVKDTVKPTIASVAATDGNAVTVTMSEEVSGTPAVNIYAYKTDGTVDTSKDYAKVAAKVSVDGKDATKVDIVLADGTVLKNAAKYQIKISGLKDRAALSMDEQTFDFTGVNDEVAPSITEHSVDANTKKLTITYSEKVNTGVGTYAVYNAATGVFVANVTPDLTDATKAVISLSDLAPSTAYTLKISGVQDQSTINKNVMDDQYVPFTTPVATVAKAGLKSVTPKSQVTDAGVQINVIEVAFDNPVTQAEVENIANYAVVEKDTPANTLAVTKAVYNKDTNTVTLTTAYQKGVTYTITVSGLSNLNTDNATTTFVGDDIVAPQLQTVTPLNLNYVDVAFNEALQPLYDEALKPLQSEMKIICQNSESLDPVAYKSVSLVGKDNNTLRIEFADKALTKGTQYTLKILGVKDKAGNYTTNTADAKTVSVTKSFTAVDDTAVPTLSTVTVDNAAKIELAFNKELSSDLTEAKFAILDANNKDVTPETLKVAVLGSTVTLENGATAFLEDGKTYTIKIDGVKSLAGVSTGSVTQTFVGKKDATKPKLTSAVASTTTAKDGKTLLTKVTLAFDKEVTITGKDAEGKDNILTPDKLYVTNASTFAQLNVTDGSIKLSDDKKSVEFTLDSSTDTGVKYKVYVKGGIQDLSVPTNALDTTANVVTFDGVDTTAPTLGSTTITGKDADGNDIKADVTVDNSASTVTIDLSKVASGTFKLGGIKLSETAAVTVDKTKDGKFDIDTPITISKDIDPDQLASMLSAIFDGSDGIQVATIEENAKAGATITLKDAVGNTRTYTLAVTK